MRRFYTPLLPVVAVIGIMAGLSNEIPNAFGAQDSATSIPASIPKVQPQMTAADLPVGSAPQALTFPHFPSRYHAFVWRNWELVNAERMAGVAGTTPNEILRTGKAMGLAGVPGLPKALEARAAITIIRRNWHLLPYDQLLQLLDWTAAELDFALREDDFLFIKLGSLKPRCEPVRHETASESVRIREQEIARTVRDEFPEGVGAPAEPLFAFLKELGGERTESLETPNAGDLASSTTGVPRICYSYFALYGDPLLDEGADPYPDALLARLSEVGINGVWLQGMLNRMAPFPWDASISAGWERRMINLRRLVARARRHGIGIYIYLNEPRAMPLRFHESVSGLKGVVEGDYAAMCTSTPEVQQWISESIKSICREVPQLAGFFTISASENLTNCWSHGRGGECPRCSSTGGASVISELHSRMLDGIRKSGSSAKLIAWDWGWDPGWIEGITSTIPKDVALMSTSEWDMPINRGGVATTVGEYSMSVIGPGPRARRHWSTAQKHGIPVLAKVQVGNTWELSAVPYIPVADTVARHAAALRDLGIRGGLLGWTLGGYPSSNLEISTLISSTHLSPADAMTTVAIRRFGAALAPAVLKAWTDFSAAFAEFPFHINVVYSGPLQVGPANLLWADASGYKATMVGYPYDDVDAWRAIYPQEVYVKQLLKVADGFDSACRRLQKDLQQKADAQKNERLAVAEQLRMGQVAAIHFRSAANQAQFIAARTQRLEAATTASLAFKQQAMQFARSELGLARDLKRIQEGDSRIGFEASNQYYYTPLDLVEKVLNCHYVLTSSMSDE